MKTPSERFFAKVKKTETCWLWIGGKDHKGYGRFSLNGRTITSHRAAWELKYGKPFPKDKFACHHCDNPSCVNPAHLFIGDNSTNLLDASAKGRLKNRRHANKEKTECLRGHSFKEFGKVKMQKGKPIRFCVKCTREWDAKYRAAKREAMAGGEKK